MTPEILDTETLDEQRFERLMTLRSACLEVYDDTTREALSRVKPIPRYALLASEGSPESTYRDNPDLVVRDTLRQIAEVAQNELDEGWGILRIVDLDTGKNLSWSIAVTIEEAN